VSQDTVPHCQCFITRCDTCHTFSTQNFVDENLCNGNALYVDNLVIRNVRAKASLAELTYSSCKTTLIENIVILHS